jgi:hypothetical protein
MQRGTLKLLGNQWYVENESADHIHAIYDEHSMWLKMFGRHDMKVCYEMINGVAILKSCEPDTREYVQD